MSVEIESEDYPKERLFVCRNPLVAEKNARTREELIAATEELLKPIIAATEREQRALKGAEKIGVRVGKVINKFKLGKYFELNLTDESFESGLKTSITSNRVQFQLNGSNLIFEKITQPTALQQKAFDLLGVSLENLTLRQDLQFLSCLT